MLPIYPEVKRARRQRIGVLFSTLHFQEPEGWAKTPGFTVASLVGNRKKPPSKNSFWPWLTLACIPLTGGLHWRVLQPAQPPHPDLGSSLPKPRHTGLLGREVLKLCRHFRYLVSKVVIFPGNALH